MHDKLKIKSVTVTFLEKAKIPAKYINSCHSQYFSMPSVLQLNVDFPLIRLVIWFQIPVKTIVFLYLFDILHNAIFPLLYLIIMVS